MPNLSLKPRRESEIVSAILAHLKLVPGVVAWRQNVGAVKTGERFVRFGFPGLSDIVGWITGRVFVEVPMGPLVNRRDPIARFLAIEVKRPGKPLSPQQKAFGEMVTKAGGLFIHATRAQDVVTALEETHGNDAVRTK